MRLLREAFPDIEIEDKGNSLKILEDIANMSTQHEAVDLSQLTFESKRPLSSWQKKILLLSWQRQSYALFLDMGLRKTGTTITNVAMLFEAKKITGLVIIAPKGVHLQWVEDAWKNDWPDRFRYETFVYSATKKAHKFRETQYPDRLQVFTLNIDAIKSKKGYAETVDFLTVHKGKSFLVLDESHNIKSGGSQRTKDAWQIGVKATYRRILTGTPMSKDLRDFWSQFEFLDSRILGYPSQTAFNARYCVMGGWEGREVVAQKNIEQFYESIAPHSFRATKDELLDLPPKIYDERAYVMDDITSEHYESLKHTFMTQLESGEIVDVPTAAVCSLKLQQLICGYLPKEDGTVEVISNNRLEILLEMVRQISGKIIIWARFIPDILRICEALRTAYGEASTVDYYGGTKDAQRKINKERFLNGDEARFFVSNQAAGGTGLDGLQKVCSNAIYYSNSFKALERWQSEDRTHRDGMIVEGKEGSCSYFDIVCRNSVDRGILRTLKKRKDLADLTLDEIRMVISGGEK